jgi:hypothetical protein
MKTNFIINKNYDNEPNDLEVLGIKDRIEIKEPIITKVHKIVHKFDI